jgi:inosine/xanthosine triphosphatase
MNRVIIAVGSNRKPKLNAVAEALAAIGPRLGVEGSPEILGFEVESGVRHTPLNREESMRGARQRAEALAQLAREENETWDFFVGLEGGLDSLEENSQRRVFLESWAFVSDGARGYYGRSGGVELPEALAHEVLDLGTELSIAIDNFAGSAGIRDAQGAWGVLSRDLITRQEAFRVAIVAAFAPFYNSRMYQSARSAP